MPNACFCRKRKLKQVMEERTTRRVIVDCVIRKDPNEDLRHQLYVLQTLLINLLEERMMTKVEANDAKALEKIKELKKIAFDVQQQSGPPPQQQRGTREDYWKKLGFRSIIDPTQVSFILMNLGVQLVQHRLVTPGSWLAVDKKSIQSVVLVHYPGRLSLGLPRDPARHARPRHDVRVCV